MRRHSNKPPGWLKKRLHSLPARILGVFIVQTILTILLMAIVFKVLVEKETEDRAPHILEDYMERVLADMPQPLTEFSLEDVSHHHGLTFALRQESVTEDNDEDEPLRWIRHAVDDDDDWKAFLNHPNWHWQFDRGRITILIDDLENEIQTDAKQLWVNFNLRQPHQEDDRDGFYYVLAVLLTMLILTYLWVRRLLKPIKAVQAGVHRYAEGEFDYRLPIEQYQNATDLTELSHTINTMAEAIANRLQKEHELFIAMSHELRTPLARMRLAIEMLEDEHLKEMMLRSHQAMEDMIQALLMREKAAQTSNQPIAQETIALKSLVSTLVDTELTPDPDQIIDIQIPDDVTLTTDQFALKLVLKNLLANAIKYGDGKPVSIGLTRDAKHQHIWIQDHGIGLSEDETQHLFEPFFRADKARARQSGGLGLGLYLSQSLAKRMGGRITVESREGVGSRFNLELPR